MSDSTKRVLVLGATGEIGGRIARGCVDAGYRTTGVTRGTNARHRVPLDGVEFITGDKYDEDFYASVLAKREFDVVIDSVPDTRDVDLAHRHFGGRIEHYLMCGSTGTFVPLLYLPADEDHPWRDETPVNFYSQCQRDAHALALWEQDGFPASILRPTNIVGTGRVPLELWGGRNLLYFRLMKSGEPVEIPGDGNVLLQSGCNDDLATAFVNAVSKGEEIAGEIFIISCKKAITLNRYFSTAKEILRSTSTAEHVSTEELLRRRSGVVSERGLRFLMEHMCFDIGKAESLLDYAPRYSVEEGLESALTWCMGEGLLDRG